MTYEDLFYRKPEAELRYHIYIQKPDTINNTKSVERYADEAHRAIREAEELIAFLKEYQKDLCARYQEITATNYTLFLLLKRHVNCYSNAKTYEITISQRYTENNVKDVQILREVFEGRDRHKALKRFEELKKQYPNIENAMEIEKQRWER